MHNAAYEHATRYEKMSMTHIAWFGIMLKVLKEIILGSNTILIVLVGKL